jgi:transposase-like protein
MWASYRLEPSVGIKQLERQAEWLEREHPTAAGSLREGLTETFTVNRIGLPGELRRCLCTTNLIESPQSGVRMRSRRVCRWRDGAMVLRWAATAMLTTEKNFRKILGYRHLWILKSYLDSLRENTDIAHQKQVG